MNFQQNTGKTISQAFEEFHDKNPEVYEHFIRLALSAIKKGKTKLSAKMIINVIRWEVFLKTEDQTLFNNKGDLIQFKVNDAFSAYYGRQFATDYPNHADKFEFRELRSK